MTATRAYPTSVIPSDPADANFESDFRTNTESLKTTTQDIDSELSLARTSNVSGTSFQSIASRLDNIENTAGSTSTANFWL